jgi:ectoine hydroxylase-related dioxygenase (phytanoyl-CoA dioxygenase family)
MTTRDRVRHKLKREVGLTWRLFNLGPTLAYRRSGERPAGEAARVLADLQRDGVAISSVSALLGSDDCLAEMRRAAAVLEREKADELAVAREAAAARGEVGQKTYLVELLGRIPTADPCSPWARFALAPEVRSVANGYFGMVTQVRDYNVWRNVRSDSPLRESQLWHRDWREDHYVLKAFVHLEDVDEGRGPFTYVPGTHVRGTKRIEPATAVEGSNRRATDEQMDAVAPRAEWVTATGPAGTLLFADTTGWHKGGSARTGDRLLYTCLFGSQAGDKRRRLRPNPELSLAEQDRDTIFALDLAR